MTHTSIKLVSLNVEKYKHVDSVLKFLQHADADVICLQELFEPHVAPIARMLNMQSVFAPTTYFSAEPEYPKVLEGMGLFTRLSLTDVRKQLYMGNPDAVPIYNDKSDDQSNVNFSLLTAKVEKENALFQIGTTHFAWSPEGTATDEQRMAMQRLLGLLAQYNEMILCGDFNAPRGREIFQMLADVYKDNIPISYTTSIDPNIHRSGAIEYMVDGLFTTPHYNADNVRLIGGVSDHCAIAADVARVE
jgi:endonuclease/exonuclease/phosphatase family metal-dependent hydrolase